MNNPLELDYGDPAVWGAWMDIHCGPYPRDEDLTQPRTCKGHPRVLGSATSMASSLSEEGFSVGR